MGDRAELKSITNGKPVYFYTHWYGSALPEMLQRALKRKERWNYPAYLNRIIFCEMVTGHEKEPTGFGISTEEMEGSCITVDMDDMNVRLCNRVFSFEEYINLNLNDLTGGM